MSEQIAKVLAEHRLVHQSIEGSNTSCSGCEWATYVPFGSSAGLAHQKHLAEALLDSPAMRDLLAAAWDEGRIAGADMGLGISERVVGTRADWPAVPANPYRAEADR